MRNFEIITGNKEKFEQDLKNILKAGYYLFSQTISMCVNKEGEAIFGVLVMKDE